eukprot:754230-Hanusia_phi.AAC.4
MMAPGARERRVGRTGEGGGGGGGEGDSRRRHTRVNSNVCVSSPTIWFVVFVIVLASIPPRFVPGVAELYQFEEHLRAIEEQTNINTRVTEGRRAGTEGIVEVGGRWFVFALKNNITFPGGRQRAAAVMCEDAKVCKSSLQGEGLMVHPKSFGKGDNGTLRELEQVLQDVFQREWKFFLIDSASDLDALFLLKLVRKKAPDNVLVLLHRCNSMLETSAENMGMKRLRGQRLDEERRRWGVQLDGGQSCLVSNEFAGARESRQLIPFSLPPAHTQQSLEQIRTTWNELQVGGAGRKRFLVFGLGHDSEWWAAANPGEIVSCPLPTTPQPTFSPPPPPRSPVDPSPPCSILLSVGGALNVAAGGETVFLEDNQDWINHILKLAPSLNVHRVTYHTVLQRDMNKFKDRDRWQELELELPPKILQHKWDVVLVDAPMGFAPSNPGRMQSIYMAKKLVRKGGLLVVDDCERPAEDFYMRAMLGEERMFNSVMRRGRAMQDGTVIAGNKQCYFRM